MPDVFKRRCGCGLLLSLRESCGKCSAAARARLHEAGIATMRGQEHCAHPSESWRRDTDQCGLCGVTGYFAMRAGKHPDARRVSPDQSGIEAWLPDSFKIEAPLPPTKITLPRSDAEDAMRYALGVDFGAGDKGAVVTATVFPGGVYRIDDVRELPGGQYDTAAREAVAALFRYLALFEPHRRALRALCLQMRGGRGRERIGSEQGLWNRVNERIAALKLPAKREPPAVGAEVSWEWAKADMMAREEARYRYRATRVNPLSEYAWQGRLVTLIGETWHPSSWTERECSDPLRRWVRLA